MTAKKYIYPVCPYLDIDDERYNDMFAELSIEINGCEVCSFLVDAEEDGISWQYHEYEKPFEKIENAIAALLQANESRVMELKQ